MPSLPNRTSDLLRVRTAEIIQLWETRANKEVLAALKIESLALSNSLPELLSQIADALSTRIDRTELRIKFDRSESLRVGMKHGHDRAGSFQYTMDQMIFEYHILRQVICDVLEEKAPLPPVDREVIVSAIEQAVNDAATEFSETLRGFRERLASALTHDLRGPITSAKMNAQMLIRHPDDVDQCLRAATRISACMDRLDGMIHDLLDAAMVRAGEKLLMKLENVDLDALARELAEGYNLIYDDRFVLNSGESALGYWSRSGVQRVVENLATNAMKYGTPKTPITLTIRQTDQFVTLSVHNEGQPISSDDQLNLFKRFRRAASSDGKTGWGLGLTVVKGLIEAHHGTFRVESAQGLGTTFTVELPKNLRAG